MAFQTTPKLRWWERTIPFMNTVIKDLILVFAVMATGGAIVRAQPVPTPPPAPAQTTNAVGPKIQFATLLYDFGRVKSGEPVKYTYIFTNTGDQVLMIKGVQPQCGCTAAGEWTREVEPGKTGQIPIQFNSSGYSTPVAKQVTVTCNVPNQPMVVLQLRGTVFKQIDISPPFLALTVPADASSAVATVTITNNAEEPLELAAPESNNKSLKVELKTTTPGKGFQLAIQTADLLAPGGTQAQITMKTSLTNMPLLTVSVYLNIQPPIVVVPAHIMVPAPPLQGNLTNSVSIQNNSTNAVTLSEPTVNVAGVRAEIREMQPGRMFTVFVEFPQGFEMTAGQPVELTIKSSNPKMPIVKVPITQILRPTRAMVPPSLPSAVVAKPALPPPVPPPPVPR
jgi:copper(I)-binding protein